ncbi:XrtA/PEP-CTERM system TPR-repeat protein PrsT [Aestuariibacter salexigens]|uniref:XrtA/PEP-CTERM system TPR-repeat protein PrsT n=1 Tax=Aestuariibacter salexigens TaxID=226010 RepID=UPI00047E72F4|nr:XrtA/PEP-CTERM system TPR-repeat protein PrsT [Aestuariibacter salexigens]
MVLDAIRIITLFIALSLAVTSYDSEAQAAAEYEQALQSFYSGNLDITYELLQIALEKNDSHLPSKILMGQTLLARGDTKDAADEFEEAISYGADLNLTVIPLAKAYFRLKQYDDLLSLSENQLDNINRYELALIKADAYQNLGNTSAALTSYEQALAHKPNDVAALLRLSSFYLINEQYSNSESLIKKALGTDENNADTLHVAGQLAQVQGNAALAKSYLKRAMNINPQDVDIKSSLATVLVTTGDSSNALRLIADVLTSKPQDSLTLLLKAKLTNVNEDASDVISTAFERVALKLSLPRGDIEASNKLVNFADALIAFYEKNYDASESKLLAYLDEEQNDLDAVGMLATTYLLLDKANQAERILERHARAVSEDLELGLILCKLYLNANKAYKCESMLDKLSRQYGDSEGLIYTRVLSLNSRQRFEEALQLFESKFADATDEHLLFTAVDLYLQNGLHDRALNKINVLSEKQPASLTIELLKSNVLIALERYQQARPIVDNILAQDPNSSAARENQAKILFHLGELEEARATANAILSNEPGNIDMLILLGRVLDTQGNVEQSLRTLEKARNLSRDNPLPSELIADIYIRQKEYDKALDVLERLTRDFFLVPEYVLSKAEIHLKKGDNRKASKQLALLYGLWSDQESKLLELSRLQIQANDITNALRSLEKAVELEPESVDSKLEMVRLYLLRGDVQEAKSISDSLMATEPRNKYVQIAAGDIEFEKNNLKQAHKYYLRALRLDSDFQLAAEKLYHVAQMGVGTDVFMSEMKAYLRSTPNAHFQRRLLADFLMDSERFDEALSNYERLVDVPDIDEKESIFTRLALLVLDKDNVLAMQYVERALDIENQSASIIDTKGWVLAKQGKFNEALTFLRQAFAMDSGDPSIRYHLAYTLDKLGRNAEAKIEIAAALASGQEFLGRQDAKALQLSLDSSTANTGT